MKELQSLAEQVIQMRLAQQTYFLLAKKPRPTRTTEDFAAIKKALEDSKKLEQAVDLRIAEIIGIGYTMH